MSCCSPREASYPSIPCLPKLYGEIDKHIMYVSWEQSTILRQVHAAQAQAHSMYRYMYGFTYQANCPSGLVKGNWLRIIEASFFRDRVTSHNHVGTTSSSDVLANSHLSASSNSQLRCPFAPEALSCDQPSVQPPPRYPHSPMGPRGARSSL